MHHSNDTYWREEQNNEILSSRMPKDFHKVLAEHYRQRHAIISKARGKYYRMAILALNSLQYHKSKQ